MPDITTIAGALGSIKTATEIAKLIKDSGTSLEQAEVKLQMAELISALADAKMEISDIQTELIARNNEITELKHKLETKESVIWEKPYYFIENSDERDGPFCQRCYDSEQNLIRLQGGKNGTWDCLKCGNRVYDKNHVAPSLARSAARRNTHF